MKHRNILGIAISIFLTLTSASSRAAALYDAIQLGRPADSTSTVVVRLSSDGHWAAGYSTFSDGSRMPTVWHDTVPTVIPNLSGSSGTANDVNNNGLVVGQSANRGFAWSGGVLTELAANTSWSSNALGVNDAGIIVGQTGGYGNFGDMFRATLWTSPTAGAFDLHGAANFPNGSFYTGASTAYDISAGGTVAGAMDPNTQGAFTWNRNTNGNWWGYIYNDWSQIRAINNDEGTGVKYVVGYWNAGYGASVYQLTAAETAAGTILDHSGQWYELTFAPLGVNADGSIVGNFNSTAYIAEFGQPAIDLQTLLVAGTGLDLIGSVDILNNGVIAANATDAAGFTSGYLLVPVPEPATLWVLLAVLPFIESRAYRTAVSKYRSIVVFSRPSASGA